MDSAPTCRRQVLQLELVAVVAVDSTGPLRLRPAMTTLEHRPHTALLVLDVEHDVVGSAHERDARGALARGCDTVLVSDARTTEDQSQVGAASPDLVIAHTDRSWTCQRAPGRTAGTVPNAPVVFG